MLFRALSVGQMYPKLLNSGTIVSLMNWYGTAVASGRPWSLPYASRNLPHRVVGASIFFAILALDAFMLALRFAWLDP